MIRKDEVLHCNIDQTIGIYHKGLLNIEIGDKFAVLLQKKITHVY